MPSNKTLIVIVGPTAIGKTALSINLAQQFSTEIISADSRQFYKEMEIGTAKPGAAELNQVTHHFINSNSIHELFSTGNFETAALNLIYELFKVKDIVVMVGGSGLYINAVCNGLDELPDIDLKVREKLNERFLTEGLNSIKLQLQDVDPEYFSKVDQANPQRMIRGLEFFLSTGQKLSSLLTNSKKIRPFNIIKIGLNKERALLYDQINSRVDQMLNSGLLNEVENLMPYRHLNALNTVGYSELFEYLDEKSTYQEAINKIKQNTRRFAKRQITWFRKDENTKWFQPDQLEEILDYIKRNINIQPLT